MKSLIVFALALFTTVLFAQEQLLLQNTFPDEKTFSETWIQSNTPSFQPLGTVKVLSGEKKSGVELAANEKTLVMINTKAKYPVKAGETFEFQAKLSGVTKGTWIYFRITTYKGNSYVSISQKRINVRQDGEVAEKVQVTAPDGKTFDKATFAIGVEKNGTLLLKEVTIKKVQ